MGGAAYARSGVLYHGTDPTNSLLLPLWHIGRAALSPAGGRPFAGQGRLYSTPAALFVHQPGKRVGFRCTRWPVEQVPYGEGETVSNLWKEVEMTKVAWVGVTRVAG